jgi:subtilisin family serine protease
MRVTVINNHLNIRVGAPRLHAPTYQYLAPGSEIEVDGEIYKGDFYKDVDTWFKDSGNNYYWQGGVEQKKTNTSVVEGVFNDFWFQNFKITEIWNQFKEKGDQACALILDTGINTGITQVSSAVHGPIKNFVRNSTSINNEDAECHGTHCASLITAFDERQYVGAAPDAKLLVGKISLTNSLDNGETLKEALREYLKDEYTIDVISLSLELFKSDLDLESLIKKHKDKGRLIIASVGNDTLNQNREFLRYPAALLDCISVGSCSKDNKLSTFSMRPSKTDIFCFGEAIHSYRDSTHPKPLTGTSQAAAIVAGISCLVVSWLKKNAFTYDTESIRHLFSKCSIGLSNRPSLRLLQPNLIFNKLIGFKSHDERNLQNCLNSDVSV